jgi:hypothetical protein
MIPGRRNAVPKQVSGPLTRPAPPAIPQAQLVEHEDGEAVIHGQIEAHAFAAGHLEWNWNQSLQRWDLGGKKAWIHHAACGLRNWRAGHEVSEDEYLAACEAAQKVELR